MESSSSNTMAKLPILKQGEFEMWKLRIKSFFMMMDYALWEVIEAGNSWVAKQTEEINPDGSKSMIMSVRVTNEKKFKTEKSAQEEFNAVLSKKLHQEELEAEKKEKEKEEKKSIAAVRKGQIEFLASQEYQKKRFQRMSSNEVEKIYEREFKNVQEKSKQATSQRDAKRAGTSILENVTKYQKSSELLRVKLEHGAELEKNKKDEEQKTTEEEKLKVSRLKAQV
ncbi:hypothetical protein OROMI_006867 [Orobanche minor]